jgi:membrane protease YdiL (CAAX protease family)
MKKQPKYIFLFGLLIAFVCSSVFFWGDVENVNISRFMEFLPPIFFLASFIIMPFFEELGFRGWLTFSSKKLIYIGLTISSLLVYMQQGIIMLAIYAISVGIFIYLRFKTRWIKQSDIALIIISSLAFGVGHLGREFNWQSIFFLGYYSGIGISLAYIRWNYGLRWSITWHYGFNITLLIISSLMGFGFHLGLHKTKEISTDYFNANLITHNAFELRFNSNSTVSNNSLSIEFLNLGGIAQSLISCDTCLVVNHVNPSIRYSFEATKSKGTEENLSKLCLNYFIQNNYFTIDTVREQQEVIFLKANDTTKLYNELTINRNYLGGIAGSLKNNLNKVVLIEDSFKFIEMEINDFITISRASEKEALHMLKEKYDISHRYEQIEVLKLIIK